MTITRMSLAHILQKEFKDPAIRKKCRDSSQRFIESDDSGMSTRVFNNFPRLLPIDEFNDLTKQFNEIYKEIKSVHHGIDSIFLSDKKDKQALTIWGKDIARRGCDAILNSYGQLQWNLMELLGWEEYPNCYQNAHIINIVSSYVATMIEQIMSSISELIVINPILYTAVCKYLNEQYREWAIKAIQSQKQDACRTQAIQFATWLINKDDSFVPEDYVVLQRLLKAEFMWDTDSILMRNEKLVFWLEVLFQTAIHKKPKIFFAMWDVFTSIFDAKKDANYLEVYQLKQYHFCQSKIPSLEKEKKQIKYRARSVYSEYKENLALLMMSELRERVALRDKNYLAQEDQSTSTTFLIRRLNESDLEFAYEIEDRIKTHSRPAEIKQHEVKASNGEEDYVLIDTPENITDASYGVFQYTVGLLAAGAKGLFLFAKSSLLNTEDPHNSEKNDDRAPNTCPSIELTAHADIRPY